MAVRNAQTANQSKILLKNTNSIAKQMIRQKNNRLILIPKCREGGVVVSSGIST